MTEPTCGSCRFWKAYGTSNSGTCRRGPPTVTGCDDDGDVESYWAEMNSGEWCGEHKPKAEPVDDATPGHPFHSGMTLIVCDLIISVACENRTDFHRVYDWIEKACGTENQVSHELRRSNQRKD